MTFNALLPLLLMLSVVLLTAAFAGDLAATRQMAQDRYRYVAVVKALRGAYLATLGLVGLTGAVLAWHIPVWAFAAVLTAGLVALLREHRLLCLGVWREPAARSFLPVLLVTLSLGYFLVPATFEGIQLTLGQYACLGTLAIGLPAVARLRVEQDLIRLRD